MHTDKKKIIEITEMWLIAKEEINGIFICDNEIKNYDEKLFCISVKCILRFNYIL